MFGFFKRRESRRINELLNANNAYLQRARDAEREAKILNGANAEMCRDLNLANAMIETLNEVFATKDMMIADLMVAIQILKENNEYLSRETVRLMYQHNKVANRLSDCRKSRQQLANRLWLQEEVNRNLSKELGERPAKPTSEAAAALGMRKPGPWDLGEGFEMREAA